MRSVVQSKKKRMLLMGVLFVTPIVAALFAMGIGRYTISIEEILQCLIPGTFPHVEISDTVYNVIYNVRLPRVLLALLAGAGLSVSGAAFQGLFSNPLATPDTMGVASGASFGAALGILLYLPAILVQIMALIWGILAVTVVHFVSKVKGTTSIIMIILAGMVVGAMFSAMVSLIKYVADPQDVLPTITFWLLGSLSGTSFARLGLGAPFMIAGVVAIFLIRWRLNAMSLHEDEAKSLGVNLKLIRAITIIAATMITASIISMCGPIGWLGLLIPHLSRMLFGNDNRSVIPSCIGMGALFLLVVDTIARSAIASEIPVSILAAVVGAPFFIILLRKTGGLKQ